MKMTSTYDHRVIQGAHRASTCAASTNCCKAKTVSTRASSRRSACSAAPNRRRRSPPADARPAVAGARRRSRRTRCCARSRPAWRSSRRIAATAISPRISIRSAREPPGDPSLDPQTYDLTPALMSAVPACVLRVKVPGNTLAEVLPHLQETLQLDDRLRDRTHLEREQRDWLRDYIESGKNKIKLSPRAANRVSAAAHAKSRRSIATCARRSWGRRRSRAKVST